MDALLECRASMHQLTLLWLVCRRLAQKLACAPRASSCQSRLQSRVPFLAEHLSSHQQGQRCRKSAVWSPAVEAASLGIAHQLLRGDSIRPGCLVRLFSEDLCLFGDT